MRFGGVGRQREHLHVWVCGRPGAFNEVAKVDVGICVADCEWFYLASHSRRRGDGENIRNAMPKIAS